MAGKRKLVLNKSCKEKKGRMEEEIVKKLLCFTCGSVPNPKEPGRNLCPSQNHPYCPKCFPRAKCCKKQDGSPSKIISSIVENLPMYCKNFQHGSREILSESMEDGHEKNCVFRTINCPFLLCQTKIVFCQLLDHLKSDHTGKAKSDNDYDEGKDYINDDGNFEFRFLEMSLRRCEGEFKWEFYWKPTKISFGGHKFYPGGQKRSPWSSKRSPWLLKDYLGGQQDHPGRLKDYPGF